MRISFFFVAGVLTVSLGTSRTTCAAKSRAMTTNQRLCLAFCALERSSPRFFFARAHVRSSNLLFRVDLGSYDFIGWISLIETWFGAVEKHCVLVFFYK